MQDITNIICLPDISDGHVRCSSGVDILEAGAVAVRAAAQRDRELVYHYGLRLEMEINNVQTILEDQKSDHENELFNKGKQTVKNKGIPGRSY